MFRKFVSNHEFYDGLSTYVAPNMQPILCSNTLFNIITAFNQSATKGTNQSYLFYEQFNGQIVDDMNGRVDIKSKCGEIEVTAKN